jgi:hypothetical protein
LKILTGISKLSEPKLRKLSTAAHEAGAFPDTATAIFWCHFWWHFDLSISGELRHRVAARIFHMPLKWRGLAS